MVQVFLRAEMKLELKSIIVKSHVLPTASFCIRSDLYMLTSRMRVCKTFRVSILTEPLTLLREYKILDGNSPTFCLPNLHTHLGQRSNSGAVSTLS